MSDHRLKDLPAPEIAAPGTAAPGTAAPGTAARPAMPAEAPAGIHLTLAARIAQRGRLRAERAARLARLRPEAGGETGEIAGAAGAAPGAAAALPPRPAIAAVPAAQGQIQNQIRSQASLQASGPATIPARNGRAPSDAQLALEEFLRALTGSEPAATPAPRGAGEVLPFQRQGETRSSAPAPTAPVSTVPEIAAAEAITPEVSIPEVAAAPEAAADPMAPAACDLDRLPGAGPGLVWALRRAGLRRLSEVAALEEADLAARLGPLGRLVPAATWIATARAGSDLV